MYEVFYEFVKKVLAGEPGDTSQDKVQKITAAVAYIDMTRQQQKDAKK